jgi:hypothetical protein
VRSVSESLAGLKPPASNGERNELSKVSNAPDAQRRMAPEIMLAEKTAWAATRLCCSRTWMTIGISAAAKDRLMTLTTKVGRAKAIQKRLKGVARAKVAATKNSLSIEASETKAVAPATTTAVPRMGRFVEPVNSRQLSSLIWSRIAMTIPVRFLRCATVLLLLAITSSRERP